MTELATLENPAPHPDFCEVHSDFYLLECELWDASTAGDHVTVSRLLLEKVINVNYQDPELGRSVFYRACGHGHTKVVELFLKDPRIDLNRRQDEGASPFCIACSQGHMDVVRLLLQHPEVNPNIPVFTGASPFFYACQDGKTEIVKLLIDFPGIDLTKTNEKGASPFLIACEEGRDDIVNMLLQRRVDVNGPNNNGATPIWMAAQNGHLGVVKALLACGIDLEVNRKWTNDKTANEQARTMGHLNVALLIEDFIVNPVAVRKRLRLELGITG